MNITPDYLIERKKYKSQIRNWKIAVICTITVLIGIIGAKFKRFPDRQPYIAQVHINNIIHEDKVREEILTQIRDDNKIKGLLVQVNSPGGSSSASERLYYLLKSIAAKKPLVVLMNDVAASGGYMISLAAEHIVAHNSTITGSIGVIVQGAELTGLAEKLGINLYSLKSGELKAVPNPLEKLTPEAHEAVMVNVKDVYNYFVDLVSEERKLSKEVVLQIADGRIYTGRQAYALKLIDEVGTTEHAIKWLRETRQLGGTLPILDVPLKRRTLISKFLGQNFEESLKSLSNLLTQHSSSLLLQLPGH